MNPPSPHRHRLILAGCAALLAFLGWIDYRTGYEFGFFIFYSLPVGLAAWHLGRTQALLMALAASLTWWLADRLAGQTYSSAFLAVWNNGIHFGSFVINAITIARIKTSLDQQQQTRGELEAVRRQLRRAQSLLVLCPLCRKPHDPERVRRKTESYHDGQPDGADSDPLCDARPPEGGKKKL